MATIKIVVTIANMELNISTKTPAALVQEFATFVKMYKIWKQKLEGLTKHYHTTTRL